jgi:hypothetical protein
MIVSGDFGSYYVVEAYKNDGVALAGGKPEEMLEGLKDLITNTLILMSAEFYLEDLFPEQNYD